MPHSVEVGGAKALEMAPVSIAVMLVAGRTSTTGVSLLLIGLCGLTVRPAWEQCERCV